MSDNNRPLHPTTIGNLELPNRVLMATMIRNRTRFPVEVTEAVCDVLGANRVGVRLSPLQPFNDMRDSDPKATFSHAVEALNRFGLGYMHVAETGKEASGVADPPFDLGVLREIWQSVNAKAP